MLRFGFPTMALTLVACGDPSFLPSTPGPDLSVPGTCVSDAQCSAPTPRCDRNTGVCVSCLPANDNCPKGQKCVPAGAGFTCSASCVSDADCPRSDGGSSMTCCVGHCFDTAGDIQNCGKCGATCFAPANATAGCSEGRCGVGACNLGFLDCDRGAANGCEVNAGSDDKNCGACGNACAAGPNQLSPCTNGACATSCKAGFADCDQVPANGCEVSTDTDVKNCGACGTACMPANGTPSCVAGRCVIAVCSPGFDDCNQAEPDGCESDLQRNVAHCGSCMNACKAANAVPACRAGSCGIASCSPGFSDCNSLVIDGCEVAISADLKNCGACGRMCTGANSVQACAMGSCQIVSCAQGFSDCDKTPANGCEINVAGDVLNCGGCGNACPVPVNAAPSCVNAQCGVGPCKFGFADCNKNANDGCEADLQTVQNCGQCGVACMAPANAAAACKAGICGLGACNMLFGDCDMNPANGCEKNLAADTSNCGKCAVVCAFANAQATCLGGQCAMAMCNPGYGDCDMSAMNGCEANFASDAKNCGKCGTVCPPNTPSCINGACSRLNCSDLAKTYCAQKGWQVAPWGTSYPNQPGGSIFLPSLLDATPATTATAATPTINSSGRTWPKTPATRARYSSRGPSTPATSRVSAFLTFSCAAPGT